MNVDEAREAWHAARETASAAFHSIYDRARAKNDKAMRQARASHTQLTTGEVAAYVSGMTEAAAIWHEIMAGPTADLDHALAEAKTKDNH